MSIYLDNIIDFEITKIYYDGNKIRIKDINSIFNKECFIDVLHIINQNIISHNCQTTTNELKSKLIMKTLKRIKYRITKYTKRGYTIHYDLQVVLDNYELLPNNMIFKNWKNDLHELEDIIFFSKNNEETNNSIKELIIMHFQLGNSEDQQREQYEKEQWIINNIAQFQPTFTNAIIHNANIHY